MRDDSRNKMEPVNHCPFDIDDPAIANDPYTLFAELRGECPVGRTHSRGGFWYVSDYENARTAFRSPKLFSNAHTKIPAVDDPLGREIPLELDGAEHSKWRTLLDPIFSRTRLENYRMAIRDEAAGLLEAMVRAGGGDFVQMFSVPFPSRIFCLIMGLPPNGLDRFLKWGRALSTTSLSGPSDQSDRDAALKEFFRAREGVGAEFDLLRTERLEQGLEEDVVSHLLASELDGRPLTQTEFQSVCQMLFAAGLGTVTATLGNIAWFLAEHPDHRRKLVEDVTLIPKAVEEFLRYESVVSPGRVVTADFEFAGQQLLAGDRVMLLTGSAGRDAGSFSEPDEVIFERQANRHLAFGLGPHRCLGSHLARMQLRVFLEELTRLMPDFHIEPGKEVVRSMGQIKKFEILPLTLN